MVCFLLVSVAYFWKVLSAGMSAEAVSGTRYKIPNR